LSLTHARQSATRREYLWYFKLSQVTISHHNFVIVTDGSSNQITILYNISYIHHKLNIKQMLKILSQMPLAEILDNYSFYPLWTVKEMRNANSRNVIIFSYQVGYISAKIGNIRRLKQQMGSVSYPFDKSR
jgi:hypothetical protein